MEDKQTKSVKYSFGCTIPIIAFICLLAVLNVVTWKTALIIGLCILIAPLAIWLVVLLFGVLLVVFSSFFLGVYALFEKIKR